MEGNQETAPAPSLSKRDAAAQERERIRKRVIALRRADLTLKEIGAEMGFNASTAANYLNGSPVPPDHRFEWGYASDATLRRLWLEGHTTAEIGRRMNITKNAVIGRARRLDLPPRESPIKRGGRRPRPSPGPDRRLACNRPPKASAAAPEPKSAVQAPVALPSEAQPGPHAEPPATPVAAPMPAPVPSTIVAREAPKPSQGRVTECAWVEGTRGRYTYCSDPTQPGSSYCAEHHKMVWKPAPKLRVTARLAAA